MNIRLWMSVGILFFPMTGFATEDESVVYDSLDPPEVRSPIPEQYTDAQRQFQGIPSLCVTPGGRLWACWYGGGATENGENYVLVVTSEDQGETWSEPLFAIDPAGPVRAYDATTWVDPNGVLWLFWAQSYQWWDGRGGVWCMTTDTPEKKDAVWSAPRRLCDGIMMNKPTALSDGRWLFPVSIWRVKPVEDTLKHDLGDRKNPNVVVSTDHGKTFLTYGASTVPREVSIFDEHSIVERNDGSLWMLTRTTYGIGEAFSTDGGRTWTDTVPSRIPHPSSRFFIRRLRSGNLILVKNGPIDQVTDRRQMTAYLSGDDGATWKGGLILDDRTNVSYPDGDQLPDGTIVVTYDYDRYHSREILAARFTESDVLAGRTTSSRGKLRLLINRATGQMSKPE
ncbi:MAG: sialidase family protein [Planctomycetia bacterium]|nr:sialidase family protein [Planctomycetia bacterium]